ncbi:MAG TPA: hypothetical protein DCM05_10575, partial [Elusimicrobia bacterium]|nr:hypothetical protein [Elusimicrobiota bacterium]
MKTFIEAFSTLLRLVLTLLLIWEQSAWAAAPSVLTYQGRLKEAGLPVQGARTVKVELCTLPAGGVCHEAANQAVAVSSGLFHVNFTVPAAADLGSGVWYVQISVGGTALTPRELLTSSAYAVYASTAGTVVDGAIDSAKLAAGAVETAKLATDAVTTAAILSGAVTDPKIASMSASKLTGALPALDGSALTGVTATGIQDGAVNSAKLASDAGSLLKVTGGIMAIDSGLIGIGTTSPAAGTELHIKSTSSNGDLKIESSDQTAVVVSAVNGSYGNIQTSQGGTNGGPLALQQAGGSVGIGTVNPAAKLDVQGGGGIRIQYGLTASTASLTGTGNTLFSLQTSSGIQVAAGGVYASFFAGDGRSLSGVVATSIADGAVDSDKLAAGAVTSSKIGALAVDSSKLSANSVDNEKLVNGAVDSWKIAADSIQALHLGAGAVETAKLAADAVTTAAILSGAVTDSKIASMSASKLTGALPALDGSALTGVTATGIQDGAVDSSKLASSAVTNAKLASGVVDSIKLASDFTSLARVSGGLLAIPSSDTGKLGVGTASPAADLHLLAPTPELYIQDSAGSVGVLAFKNNVNSSLLQIDYQGGSARLIDWVTNSKLEFLTTGLSGTQTRMTLTGDGKVGIGTGLPSAKLDVQGADGVNVQYGVSAATASFTATGDATFSLLTSSGIQVAAGGVYAPFFAGDGRSLTGVVATSIADGAVDSSKLASNAVTASKIAALSVDSSKLALGSVWADQLAAGAVDSAKLASNAVTNAKLAANAVDCTKLASDPNSLAVVSGGLLAIPAADTGKVGLGTLNASYLLHLVKNSNTLDTTQNPTLRIENTNPTPSTGGDANIANLVLSAGNGAITGALSVIHGTAVDGSVYDNNLLLAAKIGYPIDFAPSGTRSVRLSVDGRVGLGTTSPVQKLDVNGKIRLSDDAVAASAGAMRWTGTNFEGYDGAAWKALDVQAPSGGGWTEDVGNNWIYTTTGGRLVGIGNGSPTEMLDLSGAMVFRGMGAPGLSAAGQGKLFFNSGTNKLQISENGGGFTNLIGGAGGAVTLQATTPGAQDTGHLNLSGTGLFGGRLGVGTAVVDSAKLTVLGAGSDMVAFKATGAHIGDATLGNSSAIVGAGASATGAGGAKTVGASGLGGGTANDGTAQVSVGVYGRAGAASDVNDVTAGVYGEGTAGGLGKTYAGYFVSGDVFMGGNLGLGLATPSAKLDVSGTAKATAFQGDGSGLTNLSGANLAAASVDSGKLADGAVGNTKLADGSVTAAKLAAGAIDSSKIAAGAIDSARLA